MSETDDPHRTGPSKEDATVIPPRVSQPSGQGNQQSPSDLDQTASFERPAGDQESRSTNSITTSHPTRRTTNTELSGTFGRYRIVQRLGQGAMGAVYLAHDTQLDRQVALKIPFFDRDESPELIDRFRREARAMATLHHPNLCPVYDVGEIDGQQFLSMAYIAGGSLAEKCPQAWEKSDVELAVLVEKLARALDSAHQAGIVHRDLKPANIMIRPDGEPVVMDFGLARRDRESEAELTHSGMLLGTPAYMAPEQVAGSQHRIGPATDVYSLGLILYRLLSGRLPFEGSVGQVLASIIHDQPAPPRNFQPDIDRTLEAICLKAMAKGIEQRFDSAGALAEALRRFVLRKSAPADSVLPPAPARRPTATSRAAPPKRAKPAASASPRRTAQRWGWIAGVSLVAIATAVLLLPMLHRPQPNLDAGTERTHQIAGIKPNEATTESTYVLQADPFTPRADAPDQSWRLPPEPRRFPSLPDTISHPPTWLIADPQPPFNLVQHFKVPVWEDNAEPAYLRAFFEFSADVAKCFPESSRERQRQIAWDRNQQFQQLEAKWAADHQSVSVEQFEAILPQFDTGFALLRQAQRKSECVFEIGAGMDTLLPHVQALRQVLHVATRRALCNLERGRIDDALDDIAIILRLAHDANNRGCPIAFVAIWAVDNLICNEVIRAILLHPQVTRKHCARLITMLRDHEQQKDNMLRQAIQGEYIVLRVTLHDFQYRVGSYSREMFSSLSSEAGPIPQPQTPGEAMAILLSMMASMNSSTTGASLRDTIDQTRLAQRIDAMTDAEYSREVRIANAGFKALLAICDHSVWERVRLFSRIQDDFSRNQDSRIVRYLALHDALVQVDRRNRTQLAGVICLACLRQWQFDHPQPPTGLESLLTNAGVEQLTPDPYGAGDPFRWALIDGQPVIYSVGGDQDDGGGQKEWDFKPDTAGDITFRLETSETLTQRRQSK